MDFCEFLAEEELIEIIPNFRYPKKLNLISGDFGPFMPSVPIKVPIWMALNMHKQHRCTIKTPQWLNNLATNTKEQMDEKSFLNIPSDFWREIIKLLESHVDVMPNCADIIQKREALLRISVRELFTYANNRRFDNADNSLLLSNVEINNVTRGELQQIKCVVQKAFAEFQKLRFLERASMERSASMLGDDK